MSEQSAKPYLVRAICEWCADNGFTPYLAVKVNAETRVPAGFVRNGEIVLNVSATATHRLTVDNEWVQFNARFGGVSQEVAVPMSAVAGIFAKETGYGFAFTVGKDQEPAMVVQSEAPTLEREDTAPAEKNGEVAKSRPRPSHLQIIK